MTTLGVGSILTGALVTKDVHAANKHNTLQTVQKENQEGAHYYRAYTSKQTGSY